MDGDETVNEFNLRACRSAGLSVCPFDVTKNGNANFVDLVIQLQTTVDPGTTSILS